MLITLNNSYIVDVKEIKQVYEGCKTQEEQYPNSYIIEFRNGDSKRITKAQFDDLVGMINTEGLKKLFEKLYKWINCI